MKQLLGSGGEGRNKGEGAPSSFHQFNQIFLPRVRVGKQKEEEGEGREEGTGGEEGTGEEEGTGGEEGEDREWREKR
jgi:hypothetical protein